MEVAASARGWELDLKRIDLRDRGWEAYFNSFERRSKKDIYSLAELS